MYGGVRGRKTKVGGKPTFVFLLLVWTAPLTQFLHETAGFVENSGSICVFVHQIDVFVEKRGFLNEYLHKNTHLVEKSSKSSDQNEDHVLARGLQMNETG